jgi:hypothetical protein
MGNLVGFDSEADYGSLSFEALPAGNFEAVLVESNNKVSETTGCEYIGLVWEIIDGPHKGRRIWDNVIRKHTKAEAVAIGNRKLKSIMNALGPANDTSDWHGQPIGLKLTRKFNKERGEDQNNVADYFSFDAEPAPKQPPKAAPPKVHATGGNHPGKKPWGK